jgi:hypothetical protein
MTSRNLRNSIKKKVVKPKLTQRVVVAKGKKVTAKKVVVTTSDKNAQVLAATVGGAVIGNLIAPGIGGALFGGVIGALLGNGSREKGGK